jgi:hypothetical protein
VKAVTGRTVTVQFFKTVAADDSKPWSYKPAAWLDAVDALPRDDDATSTIAYNLFQKLTCTVHDENESRMLCAWILDKDNPFVYRKGEVTELLLDDDESHAEPAYMMLFPNSIAGVIRPKPNSPGVARIADFLNDLSDAGCAFSVLLNPDMMSRLKRNPAEILAAEFRIKTANLGAIQEASEEWAAGLEAAAKPAGASELTIRYKVDRVKDRAAWWQTMSGLIRKVSNAGVLDSFERAAVEFTGNEIVNLLQQRLTHKTYADMAPGAKKMRPEVAVDALLRAYDAEKANLPKADW